MCIGAAWIWNRSFQLLSRSGSSMRDPLSLLNKISRLDVVECLREQD